MWEVKKTTSPTDDYFVFTLSEREILIRHIVPFQITEWIITKF